MIGEIKHVAVLRRVIDRRTAGADGTFQPLGQVAHVQFNGISATEYSVQVVALGYRTAIKQVEARKDEVRAVTI